MVADLDPGNSAATVRFEDIERVVRVVQGIEELAVGRHGEPRHGRRFLVRTKQREAGAGRLPAFVVPPIEVLDVAHWIADTARYVDSRTVWCERQPAPGLFHRERRNLLFSREVDDMEFFFSSRRRHTSCLSDWSSDVCSSD